MCLDEVTQKDFDESVVVTGYKRFIGTVSSVGNKGLSLMRVSICQGRSKHYPMKKWLNEKEYRENTFKNLSLGIMYKNDNGWMGRYPFGFHFFQNKKDSMGWGGDLYKVKGRKVKVMGTDSGANVYVCEEMMLVEKVEG